MAKEVAYLGPALSFCEEAALLYTSQSQDAMLACPTIASVFNAVEEGAVLQGVVPIENSCEGSVNETLDILAHDTELNITGEIIIPVKHHVMTRQEAVSDKVTHILSHPQALAQCRKNLRTHFPGIQFLEVSSTAEAARIVASSDKSWAALASSGAAAAYGLSVIMPNINDHPGNETRFVALSREIKTYTENCKTSLLIHTRHVPGALYECLREFAVRGINLNKIESRPARTKIGEYMFFIDIEGHRQDAHIKNALNAVVKSAEALRILGSYPAARPAC
jgi:prephenate dehydratase